MSLSPASEMLRKYFSPGIPFKAVSIGIEINRSISSGLAPGILGDDLDQRRRGVRIGLDVQISRRVDAQNNQPDRPQQDDEAIVQTPRDESTNHETSLNSGG